MFGQEPFRGRQPSKGGMTMKTQVWLEKRMLKGTRKNGQRLYCWSLRWFDEASGKFKSESTGTADRTQAETIRKTKWAELNIAGAAPPEPDPIVEAHALPTWGDCRSCRRSRCTTFAGRRSPAYRWLASRRRKRACRWAARPRSCGGITNGSTGWPLLAAVSIDESATCPSFFCAGYARDENDSLDDSANHMQTVAG